MKCLCLLLWLFCILSPTTLLALTDADHALLLKYPPYQKADTELATTWKEMVKDLTPKQKQRALEDQRKWVKKERDTMAQAFMDQGLDKNDAYTHAVRRRIHELAWLKHVLTLTKEERQKGAVKALDFFLSEEDDPSFFAAKKTEQPSPSVLAPLKRAHKDTPSPMAETGQDLSDLDEATALGATKNIQTEKEEEDLRVSVASFTVAQLITEAENNRLRFDTDVKGRYITVTGTVSDIKSNEYGFLVTLQATTRELSFKVVSCLFKEQYRASLLKLNRGDTVRIKGLYEGEQPLDVATVTLFDCALTF